LTETWLREADFHISPTKPDHVSSYALEVLDHFRGLNPEMGFAENLGVLINMKEIQSSIDAEHQRRLMENGDLRCFSQVVPRTSALQQASRFSPVERSYDIKYPGSSGDAVRAVCQELLDRLAAIDKASNVAPPQSRSAYSG
jgi:chromosome partitioning protein